MTYRLRLQPEARDDIRSAVRWYEDQKAGLGRDFLLDVEASFAAIRDQPLRFPSVHPRFRRALLHRFPYGLAFAVADDMVEVFACFHVRRDPDVWISRG
ncbi:MAG TPA: type II toxin-antitoxin system RelE/ParE family toxin [Longimicrobiaceae bacterium]